MKKIILSLLLLVVAGVGTIAILPGKVHAKIMNSRYIPKWLKGLIHSLRVLFDFLDSLSALYVTIDNTNTGGGVPGHLGLDVIDPQEMAANQMVLSPDGTSLSFGQDVTFFVSPNTQKRLVVPKGTIVQIDPATGNSVNLVNFIVMDPAQ